ncbi:MAG TPA: SCP2 sterol-binding domain-containing protein [Smithellaceae bacterium]|nr:SCP2 sterol-binding domain-containing protein [Smithellaceae bacterium]
MGFANAEEVYKIFGMTLDKMKKENEALYNSLAGVDMVLTQKLPNLDATITLEMKNGMIKPTYGPIDIKPDAMTTQNDDIFIKFWQGKLNLMMAMTKGQVKSSGAVTKMLKLLPKIGPVYKLFAETLKEAGREDLIIK